MCSVGLPWPGICLPEYQFEIEKWKVGPSGKCTIVIPPGFFLWFASSRTTTAVYPCLLANWEISRTENLYPYRCEERRIYLLFGNRSVKIAASLCKVELM